MNLVQVKMIIVQPKILKDSIILNDSTKGGAPKCLSFKGK